MPGLIGKKVGMTRVFDDRGMAISVTVVEAGPCAVLQIKSQDNDGYQAVQLGFGSKKANRSSKAEKGQAAKVGVDAAPRVIREFPLDNDVEYEPGQALTVDIFEPGDSVKVIGTSKGKGFQGVVKRHGFAGRPSMGPGTDPSRVIKGKKLPGRMGGKRTSISNLEVVKIDEERNLLFIKGGVPGSRNSYLMIQK